MTVTVEANLVRKVPSSIAVSPPPITATSMFLKKEPSQVAHADTPWSRSLAAEHALGEGRVGLVPWRELEFAAALGALDAERGEVRAGRGGGGGDAGGA